VTRLLVVTGMSGAGRTTVLHVLEDVGFDSVDNLPIALLRPLVAAAGGRPLAIGIDSRTRGFDPPGLVALLAELRRHTAVLLIFMECDDEVLRRRYGETRRRHPMAADRPVPDGITAERRLMAPLRAVADHMLDTTGTSVADLRRMVTALVGVEPAARLLVTLVSFGFKNGLPREADLVLDLRFIRNPFYIESLRPLTGQDPLVRAHVEADPDYAATLDRFTALLLPLLPRYAHEGKSYLTIAIGCTGGQHRSVVAVEALHGRLHGQGWHTTVIHRDMPKGIPAGPAGGGARA
jgi:UPF0042 nucleotide-binding protein